MTTTESGRTIVGGSWQLQTAKARLSELFRRARSEAPQRITRQGKEAVVMIADEQFEQLLGRVHQPLSLVEFFRKSPLVGVELDWERAKDEGRGFLGSSARTKKTSQLPRARHQTFESLD